MDIRRPIMIIIVDSSSYVCMRKIDFSKLNSKQAFKHNLHHFLKIALLYVFSCLALYLDDPS